MNGKYNLKICNYIGWDKSSRLGSRFIQKNCMIFSDRKKKVPEWATFFVYIFIRNFFFLLKHSILLIFIIIFFIIQWFHWFGHERENNSYYVFRIIKIYRLWKIKLQKSPTNSKNKLQKKFNKQNSFTGKQKDLKI